jgi:hypothetical protein
VSDNPGEFRPLAWRGGRFDDASDRGPGFPVDALAELSRYERLLVQVARGIWKEENPDRERAPKRFDEGLRLRLVGVERGCVVTVLEPRKSLADGMLFQPDTWIDRAQERITDALAAVVDGNPIPADFPGSAIGSLVQFGSGLAADEACIVRGRNRTSVAYTQAARRHLVDLTSPEGIEVDGDLVGRIGELNMDKLTFEFTQLHGPRVEGRLARMELLGEVKSALGREPIAPFVRIRCQFTTDAHGRLSAINDVADLETIIAPDDALGSKFIGLLAMESGWHDGDGVPPRVEAIEWARDFVAELGNTARELRVFPTLDGGVTLEHQVNGRRWSLEIDEDGDTSIAIVLLGERAEVFEPSDVSAAAASFRDFQT